MGLGAGLVLGDVCLRVAVELPSMAARTALVGSGRARLTSSHGRWLRDSAFSGSPDLMADP
jgi:hypothetical protein